MSTVADIERLASALPDSQRAVLAARLLRSLPAVLHDQDEGVAEALARDADLDAHPNAGLSLDELDHRLGRQP
jgi:hypothetical protein